MKKKNVITAGVALLALYGIYRVFRKPKVDASGQRVAEEQPADQSQSGGYSGGYSGGGYSGGGYGSGPVSGTQSGSTSGNTGGASSSGGSSSGGGQIDLGGRSLPTYQYKEPTAPTQSAPRTNPYLNNWSVIKDTKTTNKATSRLTSYIDKIPVTAPKLNIKFPV